MSGPAMRRRTVAIAIGPCLMVGLLSQGCSKDGGPVEQAGAGDGAAGAGVALPMPGGPAFEPVREYSDRCPPSEELSLDCEWLRSLIVADVVEILEVFERSRDRRGAEKAMMALDVLDEPEILIAAGRVMGQFPDTPGLAEKAYPLFDSPYLEVQRIGADLLGRLANTALSPMGNQWSTNHSGVPAMGPYDELELPEHYAGMGFPEYPGVKRYAPADSDRSIAWWTTDPPATVTSRLAESMGVQPIDYQAWATRIQAQQMKLAQAMMDPKKMAEIQKLTEQYMKSQDPKIMERAQKLSEEMAAPMERSAADAEKALDRVAYPSGSTNVDEVSYLIAEEKDGRVARLVLVYPEAAVKRTVIQMSWNLRDYPPAWGEATSDSN